MPRTRSILIASAVALAALAGAALFVYEEVLETEYLPRNFGVVETGQIYRMGRTSPRVLRDIHREHNIRTVIDLGTDPVGSELDAREAAACADLGIARHRFNLVGDGTGDPNDYVQALRILADPANHPVLIHCGAGAQRTGAAAILYRHIVQNRPISEVYPESWEYDHEPGKDWRMLAYLADWSDEIAAAFRTGGRIEGQGLVVADGRPVPVTAVVDAAPDAAPAQAPAQRPE